MNEEQNVIYGKEPVKSEWTMTSRTSRVNDLALGPWEKAGVDDNVVVRFLERRFLKENISTIVFEIFAFLTCLLAIFVFLVVGDDIYLAIIFGIVAVLILWFLFDNFHEGRIKNNILNNKEYELCECEAYEVFDKGEKKLCYLKDTQGNVFVEQLANGETNPKLVPFYHYFSSKDYSGKLLRVKDGSKGMLYMFFPTSFLKK